MRKREEEGEEEEEEEEEEEDGRSCDRSLSEKWGVVRLFLHLE